MAKLTNKAIKILKSNPNVEKIKNNRIVFKPEFKLQVVQGMAKGISYKTLFEEAGFTTDLISRNKMQSWSASWKHAFKIKGPDCFTRSVGRPKKVESATRITAVDDKSLDLLTDKEKNEVIKQVTESNAKHQAEVLLLKKLLEPYKQDGKIDSKLAFPLIEELLKDNPEYAKYLNYFCELLGVTSRGYRYYVKNEQTRKKREEKDLEDKAKIELALKEIYNELGQTPAVNIIGTRRIVMKLKDLKIDMGRKKVKRLCRKYDLLAQIRRANPYRKIPKLTPHHKKIENLIKGKFKTGEACRVLTTDITYIHFADVGLAYLSVVKDAQTGEILAHKLSRSLKIDFVLSTIRQLKRNQGHRFHKDAIIHSDQGVHYTSHKYSELVASLNLRQSMSRRGKCTDNASVESFFGHLKDELDFRQCKSYSALEKQINHYIDYYNNKRRQWNLEKLAPTEYRYQLENGNLIAHSNKQA